jgi:hypothetical protein
VVSPRSYFDMELASNVHWLLRPAKEQGELAESSVVLAEIPRAKQTRLKAKQTRLKPGSSLR